MEGIGTRGQDQRAGPAQDDSSGAAGKLPEHLLGGLAKGVLVGGRPALHAPHPEVHRRSDQIDQGANHRPLNLLVVSYGGIQGHAQALGHLQGTARSRNANPRGLANAGPTWLPPAPKDAEMVTTRVARRPEMPVDPRR